MADDDKIASMEAGMAEKSGEAESPVDPVAGAPRDGTSTTLTPMQIFAISLAYIIDADRLRPSEEKAAVVALLGKHVSRGEFTESGMADLAQYAFRHIERQSLEEFLEDAAPRLSPLQMASIYMNVMEAMLVDGTVRESEQVVMKKFQDAFRMDQESVLAIREMIYVKNDTRMFLYPEHPRNSNDEYLAVSYTRKRTG